MKDEGWKSEYEKYNTMGMYLLIVAVLIVFGTFTYAILKGGFS